MICLQHKQDCAFMSYEKCDILTDTRFKRPCPFYKKGKRENVVHDITIEGYAETFRMIPGFEGLYYVNENGLVYSTRTKKILNWKHYKTGQPFVGLIDQKGRVTSRVIDKLVADAFLGGTGMVYHIDEDVNNCNVWNLYRKGNDEH